MRADDLPTATIAGLSAAIARKEVSPRDVVEACLARIEQLDGVLRSYITVLSDEARKEARRAEQEIGQGNYRGPLHGIPLAVKDIFQTAGVRTTCGSRILSNWVPSTDATAIRRLRTAGAILIGKLNMHEFAFRVAHPDYPVPRNPWDLGRSCAGSSSGSAAAVAATLCLGSLGTDTGGSIRVPAAYCGIVGLKPTYGLVSRTGVVPLAWTLDHVGPMTKTVEDAAIMLEVIAGYDPADPASARRAAEPYRNGLSRSLRSVRVGIPRQLLEVSVAREVQAAVAAATDVLRDLGMTMEEIDLPCLDDALAVQRTIIFSEAAAYHQTYFPARADEYGPRMREQLALGMAIPAVQYVQAQRLRRLIIEEFRDVFRHVDLLATPTAAIEASPLGQQAIVIDGKTIEEPRRLSRLTNPLNVTGLPAIAVPCGFSQQGLPLSLQLVGRPFADGLVLAAAHAYERSAQWYLRSPSLAGVPG